MTELNVTFRKDLPVTCGGCKQKFVPPDGPVIGVDDLMLAKEEIWPIVRCPGCGKTVACSLNHAESAVIKL